MAKFGSNLVPFELAKLLKNNGFNEEVKFRVYPDGMIAASSYLKNYNEEYNLFSAPTIYEAVDWIEENFNVFFEIQYHQINFDMGHKFSFQVIDITKDTFYGNVLAKSLLEFKNKYDAYVKAMIVFLEKYGKEKEVEQKEKPLPTVKEEIGIDIKQKENKFEIIST